MFRVHDAPVRRYRYYRYLETAEQASPEVGHVRVVPLTEDIFIGARDPRSRVTA